MAARKHARAKTCPCESYSAHLSGLALNRNAYARAPAATTTAPTTIERSGRANVGTGREQRGDCSDAPMQLLGHLTAGHDLLSRRDSSNHQRRGSSGLVSYRVCRDPDRDLDRDLDLGGGAALDGRAADSQS